jgi:hypothetical protein
MKERKKLIMEYKIGTKFKYYAKKHNNIYEIIDIHKTYNNNNGLVKTVYIAKNDFLGQGVRAEFPTSSISRSEILE